MKRKRITIPAPIVNFGDRVMVYNYRHDSGWEEGIVEHLRYENAWGKWSWSYDIKTVRLAKSGFGVRLYVGDDKVKKI